MRSLRPLTDEERLILEQELKSSKDIGNWKRAFVILRYDDGLCIEELSYLTLLSPWTIEDYLKSYSSKNKTKNDPRGGGSSKLTENETKQLEQHLSRITYLKIKDIVVYVSKKFGKFYSRSGMNEFLRRQGFTYKKPENVPGKIDPLKQEQFIKDYNRLKSALSSCDELIFLDAVHPEYQSQAVCGWIKKGERKTLQSTTKQKRLHFVGALNLKEMSTTVREYETIDADSMICFFKDLESTKKEGKIHIILDNAPAHRNHKLTDYLKNSRIQLHYLPPYSPNLNPIERLWKVFRETTLYNRYFEDFLGFSEAVRDFFADKVHKIRRVLKQRINDNFQIIKLNPIKLA